MTSLLKSKETTISQGIREVLLCTLVTVYPDGQMFIKKSWKVDKGFKKPKKQKPTFKVEKEEEIII